MACLSANETLTALQIKQENQQTQEIRECLESVCFLILKAQKLGLDHVEIRSSLGGGVEGHAGNYRKLLDWPNRLEHVLHLLEQEGYQVTERRRSVRERLISTGYGWVIHIRKGGL